MKSPLVYASRCLSDMEERWIPYSSLWWRFWTPRIPRGERYQEGAFAGYTNGLDDDDDDDEDLSEMSLLDIRRMLANPVIRRIYKKLPYIDVEPVKRPYDEMPQAQRNQRDAFIIESTLAAYAAGKALYPRETIAHIEAQLTAAGTTLARRRRGSGKNPLKSRLGLHVNIRQKLFSHCEAPQTAFVSYPSFDDVTTHISTWAPGAELVLSSAYDHVGDTPLTYRPGRSQIEFRTIQELTQLDSASPSSEQFAPDSWVASIGFQPVVVAGREMSPEMMVEFFGEEGAQMGVEGLRGRLGENLAVVGGSGEWKGLEGLVRAEGGEGGALRGVDKVVFFYGNGMTDDCDYCKRAMFLFAVVVRLRDLVGELRGEPGKRIPIYMPAFDTLRRWNAAELEFLEENGVEFVESNGELFLKVDERTVVVSYRNWNPVKQVVADIAKPAAVICRPVSDDPEQDFGWKKEELEDGSTLTVPTVRSRALDPTTIVVDPDSPRVRRLVKDYDKFELPELPGTTADKEVLSLYLRKPDASTEVDYW